MSRKASRKVNGFKSLAYKEIFEASPTFCPCCKKEKATQADHILAMDFLRHAPALGVKMANVSNGGALCGKCHNEKNRQESKIDPADFEAVKAHYQKWVKLHFTPTGKRRTQKAQTIDKNASYAKRIHRAKMKARLADIKGNEAMALHAHKLAAKIRREFKAQA